MALVAVAAKGLIAKVAKDALTTTILVASAAISFVFAAPWLFPALIVAGGLITWGHNVLRKVDMSLPVRRLSCMLPRELRLCVLTYTRAREVTLPQRIATFPS